MYNIIDFFKKLFQGSGFMPRWSCGKWTSAHGWLYLISDVTIGLAYFAIPIILFYFVKKKKDIPFQRVFILFSLFIVFCGLTHFVDALMFWEPLYRLNAVLLFVTAVISTITVVALYKNLPMAFNLRSPAQFQKIIDEQTAALQLANLQLKASEEQFKTLVNNNPDLITLMSNKVKYKFVNDSLKLLGGLKSEDYIGKTPEEVLPDHPHTQEFTQRLKNVLETGQKLHYETEANQGKEKPRFYSVDMIPLLNKQAQVSDVLTITKDITSIRKNEQYLKDTITDLQKLSNKIEYKRTRLQDFAYIVSHNLRSPTGNLTSLIDIYNRTEDAGKKMLLIDKIFEVAKQLAATVQDLSEVVNVNQNRQVQRELLRFDAILESQLTSLTAQVMASKATISSDFSACETIWYPKVYLESILLNLLTNALKYASPHRLPEIEFKSFLDDKGVISLTCKDNGQGLDTEKAGKKLFSLHKTFHNHPDAKGVGLFITKSQVNSLGGSITMESEPDKGATIIIRFNEIEL